MGTPKTLKQAITNGITASISSNPAVGVEPHLESHIRDFLNQKIGILMLSDNPAVVEAMERLQAMLGAK